MLSKTLIKFIYTHIELGMCVTSNATYSTSVNNKINIQETLS